MLTRSTRVVLACLGAAVLAFVTFLVTWVITAVPVAPTTGMRATIGTAALPQVVRRGTSLRQINPAHPTTFLAGSYHFTGVDAYEVNSLWSDNVGCGPEETDAELNTLFSSIGHNSVARVWFFQQFAINKYSGRLDWAAMDRTVAAATAHGVRLIATLGNQDGGCDDGTWKNPSWYGGGFRSASGGYALSYQDWVHRVTARYASSPAILAWEPTNEPRPDTCTNTADCWSNRVCHDSRSALTDLRSFYDAIGAIIYAADPNHLISDGAPPVEGCGTMTWSDMTYLEASPGIDLASYHDYSGGRPMPAADVASWRRLTAADRKPLFSGENGGVNATPDPVPGQHCPLQSDRSRAYSGEISQDFARLPVMVGWLFWNAMPGPPGAAASCDYATWPGDPLLAMLRGQESRLNTASVRWAVRRPG